MKKHILFIVFSVSVAYSQVGIGTDTPNASSALEVKSDNKGVLIPRIQLKDINDKTTIPNPVNGLIVFNLEDAGTSPNNVQKNSIYVWKDTVWAKNTEPNADKNGIYTGSGSLSGDTTVDQGTKKLAFTSTATIGTSHFSVDGSTFNIDAVNNRIGIGTAAPTSGLDVTGVGSAVLDDISVNSYDVASNSGSLILNKSRGTLASPQNLNLDDNMGSIILRGRINGASNVNTAKINVQYKGSGITNLSNMTFDTSNLERMRINENGNIGIATIDPKEKLDVAGNVKFSGALMPNNLSGTDGQILISKGVGVAPVWAPAPVDTNTTYTGSTSINLSGTSFERTALTGDVTAPANSNATTIANDVITNAKIQAGVGGIYKGSGTIAAATTVAQGTNKLAFTSNLINGFSVINGSNSSNILSVDTQNNRVGIGTIAPTSGLDVTGVNNATLDDISINSYDDISTLNSGSLILNKLRGTIATPVNLNLDDNIGSIIFRGRINGASNVNTAKINVQYKGSGITNLSNMTFYTSDIERMRINEGGNVGIANIAPTEKLDVTGNIRFSGALMPNNLSGTDGEVLTSKGAGVSPVWSTPTVADNSITNAKIQTGVGGIYKGSGTITAATTVAQGVNKLAFISNAVDGFSVDGSTFSIDTQSNRVGIGTTTPTTTLDLTGTNDKAVISINNLDNVPTNSASLILNKQRLNGSNPWSINSNDNIGSIIFKGLIGPGSTSIESAKINVQYKGNGTDNKTNMSFNTSDTEQMRINENGNIGIGTTDPKEKLDVMGAISAQSNAQSNIFIKSYSDTPENLSSLTLTKSRGNIATPTNLVKDDNIGSISFVGRFGFANYESAKINAQYKGNGTDNKTNMSFNTSNVEQMRIDEIGNVGIGTKTPTQKLDVAGNINITGYSNVAGNSYIAGRVGIEVVDPKVKLHVNGGFVGASKTLAGNHTLGVDDYFINFNGNTLILPSSNIDGQTWFLFAGGGFDGRISIPSSVNVDYDGTAYTNTTLTIRVRTGKTLIANGANGFKLF